MILSKSVTTVTVFSKFLASILFLLFPIFGFSLGMSYQRNVDSLVLREKTEAIKNTIPNPSPTSTPYVSVSNPNWYRYMSSNLDYYIDYPKTYWYGNDTVTSVSFEKKVDYLHVTNSYIFIDTGVSPQFSQAKIDELKQMAIGEVKIVAKKESSLPSQFKTYERLSDVNFGSKKAMAFVNKTVWEAREGTYLYTYIYEGKNTYIFGGLTNENKESKDTISYTEFRDIISTLRFLD
jgi:hypothetical protein